MSASPMQRPKLVLASASEARRRLLESVNITPDIIVPTNVDEKPLTGELPHDYVRRVARAKAHAAHQKYPGAFILAADTIAACGRRILGKAANEEEARQILTLLSGRRHRALSGLCIITPESGEYCRVIATIVHFKRLQKKELEDYITSGEWRNKAGCYGLQSRGGGFVKSLNGSYSNVIGLPLVEIQHLLTSLGYL